MCLLVCVWLPLAHVTLLIGTTRSLVGFRSIRDVKASWLLSTLIYSSVKKLRARGKFNTSVCFTWLPLGQTIECELSTLEARINSYRYKIKLRFADSVEAFSVWDLTVFLLSFYHLSIVHNHLYHRCIENKIFLRTSTAWYSLVERCTEQVANGIFNRRRRMVIWMYCHTDTESLKYISAAHNSYAFGERHCTGL